MNQKKTMKLWQMIVLLVLSAAILVTMFLPAYHIDSDALEKGMENAQIEDDYYEDEAEKDKDIKRYIKKFNNAVKKEKKENGTDNASISVLKLMTNSLSDIRYNKKYDETHTKSEMGGKTYDALNTKHRMTRILLWMVYSLALAVILMTILGYCLKLNKYIPLIISAVYGALAAIAFAILRFGTISGIKKEVVKLTEDFIGPKFHNIDNAKIASGFLSYAFLLGLIVAILILAVSVLSMFVGNQTEAEYDDAPDSMDEWEKDWNEAHTQMPVSNTFPAQELNGTGYSGDVQGVAPFKDEHTAPASMETQKMQLPPQTAPSTMAVQEPLKKTAVRNGKVRCTKGMTSGSPGYALTQDRKVVVGKSPHQANLVIVNNTHISNVHCSIRYDSKANTYLIKDHSTNGTFVNGVRLQKDISMEFPAGTVLSLADGSVEITLG